MTSKLDFRHRDTPYNHVVGRSILIRVHFWLLLLKFAEQHPLLKPDVSFTDRFVDMQEERIDLSIRLGGSGQWPSSVGHQHLGDERLIFGASAKYLAKRGVPLSAAELADHDAVLHGKPTTQPACGRSSRTTAARRSYRVKAELLLGIAKPRLK
ncbi:LysR substrate-binding domain-containing protein [Pseudomonas sp. NPDC089407]|uniref:LysR substrate-binding domain-containing protein n=1 Tax=Pseudomonas sp. NPDC089407 TaxID=3364464 RepID=UPI00384BD67F